jgi:hypothetical protein
MMKKNNSSSSIRKGQKSNPNDPCFSPAATALRRVQLAVKTSWTHAVVSSTSTAAPSINTTKKNKRIHQQQEDAFSCQDSVSDVIPCCHTIDDALASLYTNDRNRHSREYDHDCVQMASSYVPEIPSDWLLDGTLFPEYQRQEQQQQTQTVLQRLSADPIPEIVAYIQQWEQQKAEEQRQYEMLHNWNPFPQQDDEDDEIDFGDFQVATDDESETTIAKVHSASPMAATRNNTVSSPSESSLTTYESPNKKEEEEKEVVISTTSTESSSTPVLVARADAILAQYQGGTNVPIPTTTTSTSDDEEDASASASVETSDLMHYTDQIFNTTTVDERIVIQRCPDNLEDISNEYVHESPNREEKEISQDLLKSVIVQTSSNDDDSVSIDNKQSIEEYRNSMDTMESTDHPVPRHQNQIISMENVHDMDPVHDQEEESGGIGYPNHWNDHSHHRHHSSEEVESIPLSLRLPLDDLTLPEARFVRRLQQQQQQQTLKQSSSSDIPMTSSFEVWESQDINRWPDYYFTNPDLDDTVSVLLSLPWHHVHGQMNDGNTSKSCEPDAICNEQRSLQQVSELWDQDITARLCELDAASQRIQNEILVRIQPHRSVLEHANALLAECEKNIRLAFLYHERSLEAIHRAKGSESDATGLVGHAILLQAWTSRDQYSDLNGVLKSVDEIWKREKELIDRIDNFDLYHSNALEEYRTVMALTDEAAETISSNELVNLRCLDGIRVRLSGMGERFWGKMLQLANEMVAAGCRKKDSFDWAEYERLIQAAVDLHAKADIHQYKNTDLPTSWTKNMLTAFCFEADRTLASSLIWPVNRSKSDFEEELREMAFEIDRHWGDCAKLKTISHNLVTIRFVYESKLNYLPRVFRRLCEQLLEILFLYDQMKQWHMSQSKENPHFQAVFVSLEELSNELWDYCVGVVTKCLDEFLHFSANGELFIAAESGVDDSLWRADLDSYHHILLMTGKFLSLKHCFLNVKSDNPQDPFATSTNSKSNSSALLLEKLSDVFRRHLRTVHVEAMNAIGRKLASESWTLHKFSLAKVAAASDSTMLNSKDFLRCCLDACENDVVGVDFEIEDFSRCSFADILSRCDLFDIAHSPREESQSKSPAPRDSRGTINSSGTARIDIFELLDAIIHDTINNETMGVAPQSVTKELVSWASRLLATMRHLPLIAEDVSAVVANLSDLYITTVLRLCAGSAKGERILLGEDPISKPCQIPEDFPPCLRDENSAGSPIFSSFRKNRRQSYPRTSSILSTFLEAEICAPLPRDSDDVKQLNAFVKRAQSSLKDVVNLDMVDSWIVDAVADNLEEQASDAARLLAKRQGAILGCIFVAGFVDAVTDAAGQFLSAIPISTFADSVVLNSLRSYNQTCLNVTPILLQVTNQIACARAVSTVTIVSDILKVASGWEEAKLHEHPNDYVDLLTDKCSFIWGYLVASTKMPQTIMKNTWENLVQACYVSMLEGFSRVSYCSTEGRALMKLDLACFAAGITPESVSERLDNILPVNKPPTVHPARGMTYVDTFVKVFYYPKDDAMQWIAENYSNYHMNHSLALANSIAASNPENYAESYNESAEYVKSIYLRSGKSG